jgi:hypothetical protein
VDHKDLLERYDTVCASHDSFRANAHKELRLCHDTALESQRNLVIQVEEVRDKMQAMSDQLTTIYTQYLDLCPRGYTPWQCPPPPTIIPPINFLSSAALLMQNTSLLESATLSFGRLTNERCSKIKWE